MKPVWGLCAIALVAATMAAAPPVPRELIALAAKARLESPVVGWCRGEFRSGRSGAYAVAIGAPESGGRYLVLDQDATVVELATFARDADVACYTAAEARKLNGSIARSETIEGRIAPQSTTTVVCVFVDVTHAVCFQYSPSERRFVQVGEWIT